MSKLTKKELFTLAICARQRRRIIVEETGRRGKAWHELNVIEDKLLDMIDNA